ncbi:MAG: hypothetical protein SWH68_12315 [Thermodesulfobacteriota bacterium]|nr:hypothetical protein [Thermodesulfobacteriota bacterium]
MAEIKHTELEQHLADAAAFAPVYLIYGEPFFYKKAFDTLVSAIVPDHQKAFNLEILDGTEENVYEAIERAATFSLDSAPSVIGFCDTHIFHAREDKSRLVNTIKTAAADNEMKKAANAFIKLLSLLDIDMAEINDRDHQAILGADPDPSTGDPEWLAQVRSFCSQNSITTGSGSSAMEALQRAVEKGFAPGNHLVITTEVADKRRKLYKTIREHGVIVDCAVAKGSRQADKRDQQAALTNIAEERLKPLGKSINRPGFEALCEKTGFDPHTFANSLEKLAAYAADRDTITPADVTAVLRRTRTDPIYELTNAIADRAPQQALFLAKSLLSGPDAAHPLQVIAAIGNQIRKLTVIRDFMESDQGKCWHDGMGFDQFKRTVAPALEAHDATLIEQIKQRDAVLTEKNAGKKSKKKTAAPTDLLIGANMKNLYPTFKNFEKTANFSLRELLEAFRHLQNADLKIKRGGDAVLIMEHLIMTLAATAPSCTKTS